mmetsp:Transcript_64098/g.169900  ORF Transcript_64098/g.169900 Transcript_64098/m.169900 type:complete len:203 (-) Transcript_64098:1496-2104(-)
MKECILESLNLSVPCCFPFRITVNLRCTTRVKLGHVLFERRELLHVGFTTHRKAHQLPLRFVHVQGVSLRLLVQANQFALSFNRITLEILLCKFLLCCSIFQLLLEILQCNVQERNDTCEEPFFARLSKICGSRGHSVNDIPHQPNAIPQIKQVVTRLRFVSNSLHLRITELLMQRYQGRLFCCRGFVQLLKCQVHVTYLAF